MTDIDQEPYILSFLKWAVSDPSRRLHFLLINFLVVLPAAAFLVIFLISRPNYQLSPAASKLVGSSDSSLSKNLKYDASRQAFYLNQSSIGKTSPQAGTALQIGKSLSLPTYSLQMSTNLAKGISYYDNQTNLSFNLIPNMPAAKGKLVDNRLIYPINHNEQAVYTVKTDGLKEDIVLSHDPGKSLDLSYTLKLPSTMVARSMPGGAVGIYSANPALFGNISFGSSADEKLVQKARLSSPKNYMVFALTAPIIYETGSNSINANGVKTSLSLKGNTVTIVASNLSKAVYPLSIDPSVIVASLSAFASGNDEGDIGCISSNEICEYGLNGGSLSAGWTDENTAASGELDSARQNSTSLAYDGYLYILGGTLSGGSQTAVDEYSFINSNGTLSAPVASCNGSYVWCSTTSLPTVNAGVAAVVYDNYLYIEDAGFTGHSIWFATINSPGSNGALGAFNSSADGNSLDTGFVSNVNAPTGAGMVAYNGYLYLVGGLNTSCTYKSVYYAHVNGDGGLSNSSGSPGWTSTTGLTNVTAFMGVAAYNGYLYMSGGLYNAGTCGNSSGYTSYATSYYIPINTSTGALYSASWTSTGSSLPSGSAYIGYSISNGYIYAVGGEVLAPVCSGSCTPSTTYFNNVYYASINSGGGIGSWYSTSSPVTTSSTLCGTSSVIYNNYIYSLGGSDDSSCGTTIADVYYAAIDVTGIPGQFVSEGNFSSTQRTGAASVASNGFLYVIGGDNSTPTVSNEVDVATLSSSGSITAWNTGTVLPSSVANLAVTAYNGYIYAIGGCTTYSSPCGSDSASVYSSPAGGTLAWSTGTSITTARDGLGAFAYNGYLYIAGGFNGSTAEVDTQSIPISATNGQVTGTWSQNLLGSQSLSTMHARGYFGLATYGGYVYIVGGQTSTSAGNCTSGSSGTFYCNDVWYSTITSSGGIGTLGGWTPASSYNITTARASLGAYAWNGYLYIMGGVTNASATNCTTGSSSTYYCNDIQFIPVTSLTSGSGNNWATSTATWSARNGLSATAYQGTAYVMGGYNGTTFYQDSWYAPINNGGPGTLGAWATNTNYMQTPTYGFSSVAYNGELYITGGVDLSSGNSGTTYTNIVLTGSTSWTAPTGVYAARIQAWGAGGGGQQENTAGDGASAGGGGQYSTGVVNGLVPGTTYPIFLGTPGAGGTMAGGSGGAGGTTTFNTSSITAGGGGGGTTASGGAGGSGGVDGLFNGGHGGTGNTLACSASGGGAANGGSAGGNGGNGAACPVNGGAAGTVGGADPGVSAPGGNGVSGNSNGNGQIAQTFGGGGSGAHKSSGGTLFDGGTGGGGAMYLAWDAITATNAVETAAINPDGTVGTVTAGTSLHSAVANAAAVAYNGYLYVMGGTNLTTDQSSVQYAQITSPGTLAAFTSSNLLTGTREGLSAVAYNGYLIAMGGESGGTYENDVQYSQINSSTHVPASFTTSTYSFSNARSLFGATIYDGYIYLAGGWNGSTYYNDVQSIAAANAISGSGGGWSPTTSFYNTRAGLELTAYNGYLYLLGGYNGTNFFNDTQYAPINSDGSIGNWSSVPEVYTFTVTSANATAGATYTNNGVTFTVASTISAQTTLVVSTSSSTEPLTSGTLTLTKTSGTGDSTITYTTFATNNFTTGRYQFGSVAYNGYVYVMGGLDLAYNANTNCNNDNATFAALPTTYPICNDVQYASLNSIPRVGNYSYHIDNGADVNPLKIFTYGSNTGNLGIGSSGGNSINSTGGLGGILFNYEFATNACKVFNAETTVNSNSEFVLASPPYTLGFTTNGTGCAGATNSVGQYGWLNYELDDSQTASFPDISGNHSTITGIYLYYHPNPGDRLRGGGTFANGSLQSLDTPP